LLATSKIKITDTKKSGILYISALLVAISISITLFLIFAQVPIEQRDVFVDSILLVTLFSSVIASLITVYKVGIRSNQAKYYLSLFIAMALWFCAESIWAYSFHDNIWPIIPLNHIPLATKLTS
jgi:hypothetical protein